MSITIITQDTNNGSRPPIVGELEAIFKALPDQELLAKLRGPKRRGRPGYEPKTLWRAYVVYYALGIESVSALIRLLHNNPYIAHVCGINWPEEIPSQPTFSRFGTRLTKKAFGLAVKNIMCQLTRRLYERLPDFGKSVAIDSTDIKAWSNGSKRGRQRTSTTKRQRSKVGKVSDPDGGWCVKANSEGNRKFVWGYKVHLLCDARYELPMGAEISSGNVHDLRKATALLTQVRRTHSKFHPQYVICDAGYSSDKLRRVIKRQYRAQPIIDPHPTHKKAVAKVEKFPEWKAIYNSRTAIERLNGRLKAFYKLNAVRVRGRMKVRVHALLSVIMLQARALAFPNQLRHCVRSVV
jgi:transposase